MSVPYSYSQIIDNLFLKSNKKAVAWSTTTDSDTFIVHFNNFSLSICSQFFPLGSLITIELINTEGKTIDRFSINENDVDWGRVNELYELARRSALSIDRAIKEMLAELNQEGTIGN